MKSSLTWLLALLFCVPTFAAEPSDAPRYPVSKFIVDWHKPKETKPDDLNADSALLKELVVELSQGADGALQATGSPMVKIKLGDELPAGTKISELALLKVIEAIVPQINARGYFGILAVVDRDQIDPSNLADRRSESDKTIRITVWFSEIAKVRSVAKGTRIGNDAPVDNPKHARILKNSPLQPGMVSAPLLAKEGEAAGASSKSGFKRTLLDDYLRRLNRQPGRSVEAALSSTEEPGKVVLDYLVSEPKPWLTYLQVSNTGTSATDALRERVGVVHNQLLSRDDIASLDYITSNVSKANAVFGSYNYPLWYPDRLRVRVYGSWGDFNATTPDAALPAGSVVAPPSEKFSGDSWTAGGELIASPFSIWNFAIDFTAGVMSEHVSVNNKTLKLKGSAEMLNPYVSLRAERTNQIWSVSGSVGYETGIKELNQQQLVQLGRLDTQDTYDLLRGEFNASTYLEPLLFGLSAKNDWRKSTLAHEITFHARGQYVLGSDRMIPQKEGSVGGYFSVRGYPESAVAGDNVYSFNAEYRFHIPRALRPASIKDDSEAKAENANTRKEPSRGLFGPDFNYRPPQVYARPDWDLIARTFFDAGFTDVNLGTALKRRAGENNYTLMSTGVGLELQMYQNINMRVDWGYVLEGIKTGIKSTGSSPYLPGANDTKAGSSRVHALLTLVW